MDNLDLAVSLMIELALTWTVHICLFVLPWPDLHDPGRVDAELDAVRCGLGRQPSRTQMLARTLPFASMVANPKERAV